MIEPGNPALVPDSTSLLNEFGIDREWLAERQLILYPEAANLVVAQIDPDGRKHLLTPETAAAWEGLVQAAEADGIALHITSAFRSVARQAEICRHKQAVGQSAEEIFTQSAPPGFSEHHTGCAIDVGTPGCPPCTPEFETTSAFAWLSARAGSFGFHLSFPRNNPQGFVFEPWHWRFALTP